MDSVPINARRNWLPGRCVAGLTVRTPKLQMAKIEDYGFLSDTQSAALVSREGSIDWLCLPRFDSGACFASLLHDQSAGHWTIAATDPRARVSRSYVDDTLVLQTRWETEDGA